MSAAFMGDYSAEEQTTLIAQKIADTVKDESLLSYPTDIKTLAENEDYHKALTKLIDESERLFVEDNEDDDILGAFNCISLLLCSKLEAATIPEVAINLADKVCQHEARAPVRLRIFSNLFNSLEAESATRYELYLRLVEYACRTNTLKLIKPDVDQVDGWLKVWGGGVTVAQARTMYRAISSGLTGLEAQKFVYKFLETYNGESEAELATVKDVALESMVVAMKEENTFQLDFLTHLHAVKQLAGSNEHALFDIFLSGTIQDLDAFTLKNAGLLESLGLDVEEAKRKLKLLTLVSLCTGKKEVAYDEIRKVIGLAEDETELFIIDAISTKVIEAKMDQMRQVLVVRYVMQRSFTTKQWDVIEEKLTKFRNGLMEVLTIRKQRK